MSDFRFTRPDPFPPIVKSLVIINVLVFLIQITLDAQFGITNKIAVYPLQHPSFEPYQIATHMFAHGSITHILFNMISLWMFGRELENRWGPKRFLLFYLICGVGAAALHLGIQYFMWEQADQLFAVGETAEARTVASRLGPALGASGAIMGIFAAYGYLFPNNIIYLYFAIPVKAKWLMIGLAAIDLFGGIAGTDNVAHFAHLGGALTGFILVLIWNKSSRKHFY